jgi:tight adherence protein B
VIATSWLLLGLGVALLPATDPAARRVAALAAGGRLAVSSTPHVRRAPFLAIAIAGAALGSLAVWAWRGPALAFANGVVGLTATRLAVRAVRERAARARAGQLLTALRLLAAELEAGSRPGEACAAAAEAAPIWRDEFAAAAVVCARGHDPPFAEPELQGLGCAWTVAARTGAPLARVVRQVADDCAVRAAQWRAVTAAVAGARSSAALLAGLPVLGLLLGAAMQADPLTVLFDTKAGQVVCLLGVTLDAAGVLWTHRLAARAVQP